MGPVSLGGARLRTKVLSVLALTMAGLFALLHVGAQALTLGSFEELERAQAYMTARRVQRAMDRISEQVDRRCCDAASREPLYESAMGTREPCFDACLSPSILSGLGADFALVLDKDGRPLARLTAGTGEGARTGVNGRFPEGLVRRVRHESRLLAPRRGAGPRPAMLTTDDGPLLVSAQPIAPRNGGEPAAGVLVMGRFVDADYVARVGSEAGAALAAHAVGDPDLPADVATALTALGPISRTLVNKLPGDRLGGYVLVDDLGGSPLMVLSFTSPRTIYQQGRATLAYLLLYFAAVSVVVLLVAWWLLERQVVTRLLRLHDGVARISASGDLSWRIEPSGRDEIGSLSMAVNTMLDRIGRAERRAYESRARHMRLLDGLPDAAFVVDADGSFTYANPKAQELLGFSRAELRRVRFPRLLTAQSAEWFARLVRSRPDEGTSFSHEIVIRNKRGASVPVELSVSPVLARDGSTRELQCVARDISDRKRFEGQLLMMAGHDHLTGLLNRRGFDDELERQLSGARRHVASGSVLWLDIDQFKDVNDSFGHHAGDEILVQFAGFLRRRTRGYGVLARMGGDEFAYLMPGADAAEAEATANRIMREVREHAFEAQRHHVRLTVSVGVVAFPAHGTDADDLLSKADMAMYRAKEQGRDRACVFAERQAWRSELRSRLAWADRIERALKEGSFLVYAQPIYDCATGAVSSYELLIRMQGERGTVILPGAFMTAAERAGKISRIDQWMLRKAIQIIADCESRGVSIRLEVNVSGSGLSDDRVLETIAEELDRTGIRRSSLGIEVTETVALLDMAKAKAFISTLDELGCRFALDDFGSGFSSFYYLKHLPVSCVKIDGSYIRDLPARPDDQHLVRSMVELSRALGMSVTAEWVEDSDTFDIVKETGATHAQGFYLGEPVPIEKVL